MTRITQESKGVVISYANRLWDELFDIQRLVASGDVGRAYTRLLYLIPLLPKSVADVAEPLLKRGVRKIREATAVGDSITRNRIRMSIGRTMLASLIWRVLKVVSEGLERENLKVLYIYIPEHSEQ